MPVSDDPFSKPGFALWFGLLFFFFFSFFSSHFALLKVSRLTVKRLVSLISHSQQIAEAAPSITTDPFERSCFTPLIALL